MITRAATLVVVEQELEGALAWARRFGHDLTWLPDTLKLRLTILRRADTEPFYLTGEFEGYPILPPALTFTAQDGSGGGELQHFPRPGGPAPFNSWIFIVHEGRGMICAPFNRLAYAGPHKDWGDATRWRNVAPSYVQAHEIGPMLSVIDRDLHRTNGRMG